MVSLSSLKLIKITTMAKPLFAKCRRFFPDIPEHIFRNLLLVCSAITLARSTNLNVLKDYLPQLLANEQTKADSHYKILIRFFRVPKPNRLVICILQFVFRLFQIGPPKRPHYPSNLGRDYLAGGQETHSFVNPVHPLPGYSHPNLLGSTP